MSGGAKRDLTWQTPEPHWARSSVTQPREASEALQGHSSCRSCASEAAGRHHYRREHGRAVSAGAAAHLSKSEAEGDTDQDVGDRDPRPLVERSQQRSHQLFSRHRVVRECLHKPLQAHTSYQAYGCTNAAKPSDSDAQAQMLG